MPCMGLAQNRLLSTGLTTVPIWGPGLRGVPGHGGFCAKPRRDSEKQGPVRTTGRLGRKLAGMQVCAEEARHSANVILKADPRADRLLTGVKTPIVTRIPGQQDQKDVISGAKSLHKGFVPAQGSDSAPGGRHVGRDFPRRTRRTVTPSPVSGVVASLTLQQACLAASSGFSW